MFPVPKGEEKKRKRRKRKKGWKGKRETRRRPQAPDKFALSTARMQPRINRETNIIIIAPTSGGERVVSRQRSFHNFATFVKISKRICKFSMEFKRSGVEFSGISRRGWNVWRDGNARCDEFSFDLDSPSLSLSQRVTPPTFCPSVRITTQSGSARVLAKQ